MEDEIVPLRILNVISFFFIFKAIDDTKSFFLTRQEIMIQQDRF